MKNETTRTILVAVIGTSPAVLTETIWALAHQDKPAIPDEVVVLTTKPGKEALLEAIMSGNPSILEQLKSALCKEKIPIEGKLIFGETSIRVIPDEKGDEAGDLRTGADNLRAADFMLGELRKYTEDPETIVLSSIAGGRKTMSALLFSCMTLLGRVEDKVYHVLIPPEYECGMEPPFYFPQKGTAHQLLSRGRPTGRKVSSTKIGIELFEVPFVRMRGWYQEKFKTIPPSYMTLISKVQGMAPPANLPLPLFVVDASRGILKIDGKVCELSDTCFALMLLIARGVYNQERQYETLLNMAAFTLRDEKIAPKWFSDFRFSSRVQEDDNGRKPVFEIVPRLSYELRKSLEKHGLEKQMIARLIPKRGRHVEAFPSGKLKVVGDQFLQDVRGYPKAESVE